MTRVLQGAGARTGRETARHSLRRRTAAVHEALHAHPGFAALAGGRITAAGYLALMDGLHAFHAAADPRLDAVCRSFAGPLSGARHVPRAPRLAADLAAAGRMPSAPVADPGPAALPALATPEAAAGALYVLDGAMLGAATLERALSGRRDLAVPTGFWAWCRDEGPALWRRTRALLAARDTGPAARGVMGEAAEATFAAFAAAVGQGDADG